MDNTPDIVQRITQHIQSFQRSKVQLGEPREVVMPAARAGDLIKHKSFWGALAGAIVGAMVNSAPYLLCGLLGPFGVAARAALTIGCLTNNDPTPSWADKAAKATEEFVNEIFDSPDGEIILGNSNVLVNGKPIATALIPDSITCDSHALQMIAEGSENVFVAGKNVARKGDKTTCGAVIQNGSPNVFIGSGKTQVTKVADEFSFMQQALLVAIDMGFPPSKKTMKNGLGKIRLGIDDFSKGITGLKKTNIPNTVSEVIRKAEIKPNKPFKLSKKHNTPELKKEFERQLKDQQDAINKMKVKDWLKNREEFERLHKPPNDQYILNARKKYGQDSKKARSDYRNKVQKEKYKEFRNKGLTKDKANFKVKEYLKDQAALHNPDSIAGGKHTNVTGLGNSKINSSIGSQWKSRVGDIEAQVKQQYGIPPKTIENLPDNAMMNIKLL